MGVAATGGDQGGAKMVDMHSATICPLECSSLIYRRKDGQDLLHRMIEAFHCHLLTWFASQLMQPTIDRSFFLHFAKKKIPTYFLGAYQIFAFLALHWRALSVPYTLDALSPHLTGRQPIQSELLSTVRWRASLVTLSSSPSSSISPSQLPLHL